jgi:predicted small lipoprotein YifL
LSHVQLSIILFACVVFINACGQSGDLYLPEEEPQEQGEQVTGEAESTELQEEESKEE